MGWTGEKIMDGDNICTTYYDIMKKAKIKEEKYEDNYYSCNVKFDKTDKIKFEAAIPKILDIFHKKPLNLYVRDDVEKGLFWQAFAKILMDNKINIDPIILSEYFEKQPLVMEHANSFCDVKSRKKELTKFNNLVSNYSKKMTKLYYPSKVPGGIKTKVL